MPRLRSYALVLIGLGPFVMGSGWGAGGCGGTGGAFADRTETVPLRLEPGVPFTQRIVVTSSAEANETYDVSVSASVGGPGATVERVSGALVQDGRAVATDTDELSSPRAFFVSMRARDVECTGGCTQTYDVEAELTGTNAIDVDLTIQVGAYCEDCDDDDTIEVSVEVP